MSLLNVLNVASSAMHAQTIRLNSISSNLSNQDSVVDKPENAYKAKYPVFQAMANAGSLNELDQQFAGVQVSSIVESNADLKKVFNPGHPMADKSGFVTTTNVNAIEEMTNMIAASKAYQDSIQVFQTAKSLMMKTISSLDDRA